MRSTLHRIGLVILITAASASSVVAQRYPSQPITLVVPFAPGGTADSIARLMAGRMTASLGQPVIVENRTAAGGELAARSVAISPPNGYTLILFTSEIPMHDFRRTFQENDFTPISIIAKSPIILLVNSSKGITTARNLASQSKQRNVSFGEVGLGPGTAMKLFERASEGRFTAVPYRSSPAAFDDLVAGHIDALFTFAPLALQRIPGGRILPLGVASDVRSPLLPDVPTLVEEGFPVVMDQWVALFAPRGTPTPIIETLNARIRAVLADRNIENQLAGIGFQPLPTAPNDFVQRVNQLGGAPTCGTACPSACKNVCTKDGERQCCQSGYPIPP
jgi:tripartite-type tricarboxylate transporter receptor subunit TctC